MEYSKTAFLVVDLQNDFCPAYTAADGTKMSEGALAIKDADKIIPSVNKLTAAVKARGGMVLATQDWHPRGHVSFASTHAKKPGDVIIIPVLEESVQDFGKQYPQLADSVPAATQQFLWPDHCIQQSQGARFHSDFDPFCIDYVFRKGYHKHIDSYSAFFENDRCTPTDLPDYLKDRGVKTVILAGLATDYCVFYSAVDSTRLGYETHVVIDASAAVDSPPNSLEQAIVTMKNSGVQFNGVKDFL